MYKNLIQYMSTVSYFCLNICVHTRYLPLPYILLVFFFFTMYTIFTFAIICIIGVFDVLCIIFSILLIYISWICWVNFLSGLVYQLTCKPNFYFTEYISLVANNSRHLIICVIIKSIRSLRRQTLDLEFGEYHKVKFVPTLFLKGIN